MADAAPHPFYIVIATGGDRPALLERTLQSLAACERPPNFQQTIVIENGGDGSTEQVVAPFTESLRLRYLHQPQGNKSRALNTALQAIEQGLIFFTDDDVRLAPHTLTAYAHAAAPFERGVYFGGPTTADYESDPPPDWLRPFLPLSAIGFELANQRDGHAPQARRFQGCNWAAFVEDVKALGGFNPERGPGASTGATGQESEMQDRLRHAGLKPAYVPEARVWHWVPADRCSPEWTLHRRYRHALAAGIDAARNGRPGTRWTGPLRNFAYLVYRWLQTCPARLTGPPERRAFLRRLFPAIRRGLREGYGKGHAHD